jgi:hypothetical protein
VDERGLTDRVDNDDLVAWYSGDTSMLMPTLRGSS